MTDTTFIYALCEPGTRTVRYIGKANDPKRRFRGHLSKSGKFDTDLGRWFRSLKGEKPELIVLREVSSEQWESAEERYIRLARGLGMKLVNGTDGGDGVAATPEVRAKMSASHTGVRLGPGHCAAIASGHTGLKRTPEQCAAVGDRHRGKKLTPAQCEAMSIAMSGDKNPNFGRPRPLKTRLKIAESNRGQKRSLEARENMRVAAIAAHARKKAAQA